MLYKLLLHSLKKYSRDEEEALQLEGKDLLEDIPAKVWEKNEIVNPRIYIYIPSPAINIDTVFTPQAGN